MTPTCQQTIGGYVPYWADRRVCGKTARWGWTSPLRGPMCLCTRHARAVGLKKCRPLVPSKGNPL